MGFLADSHEITLHGYCAAHEPTAVCQAAPTNSHKGRQKPSYSVVQRY